MIFIYINRKSKDLVLGIEPGPLGWKAQTDPLSYEFVLFIVFHEVI